MVLVTPSRRGFIAEAIGLLAAPTIVRSSSLMQVRAFIESVSRPKRFSLDGPHGRVIFSPASATMPGALSTIGVGEPIFPGEFICVGSDGYAYKSKEPRPITNRIYGMAVARSKFTSGS